jgi:hypothetical protein
MKKTFTYLAIFFCGLGLFGQESNNCYEIISTITRPDFPSENVNGPYYPGEKIKFHNIINYFSFAALPPGGNNCQWISGIVPALNENLENVTQIGLEQNWNWFNPGIVDYNLTNNKLNTSTSNAGHIILTYDELGNGNVTPGTVLPGGWWATSNGGGTDCTNDGDPDNMWGYPSNCSNVLKFEFDMEVRIKNLNELNNENLNADFTLFAFSDGEIGCWANGSCQNSKPFIFNGLISTGEKLSVNNDQDQSIKIFPTLTDEKLFIDNTNVNIAYSFSIYNNLGILVAEKSNLYGKTTLDVTDWSKGHYNIQVTTSNGKAIKRLMKL